MKKLLFVLMLIIPLTVNADIKVINHYIDSEIEIAGALNVKELIIVEGTGEFFQRNLNYYSFGEKHWKPGDTVNLKDGIFYNAQSIAIVKVGAYEFKDGDKVEFGSFDKNVAKYFSEFNLKDPKDKAYTFTDKKDGNANIKVFYPLNNKRVAFYINYTVNNAVVKHNDIKEINYSFKHLSLNAKETYLRVIIPYKTQDEKYNFWVHGNQSGEVEELVYENGDKIGFLAKFPEVNDLINFRITLPSNQVGIDVYLNNSEMDALDEILKIEKENLTNTNKSNSVISVMNYVLLSLGFLYIIGSFILLKINYKQFMIIYLLFGLFIGAFNYLFRLNYWFLYIIILFPLIIMGLKKYIINKK